jgi:3-dehydroquinate synthetase
MHGEAVNIDGFLCCLLSFLRGYISMETVNRVFKCMESLSLPTTSPHLTSELVWQSCKDAVEHRHGEQRIPLITDIGESIVVSDISPEELDRALELLKTFNHTQIGK